MRIGAGLRASRLGGALAFESFEIDPFGLEAGRGGAASGSLGLQTLFVELGSDPHRGECGFCLCSCFCLKLGLRLCLCFGRPGLTGHARRFGLRHGRTRGPLCPRGGVRTMFLALPVGAKNAPPRQHQQGQPEQQPLIPIVHVQISLHRGGSIIGTVRTVGCQQLQVQVRLVHCIWRIREIVPRRSFRPARQARQASIDNGAMSEPVPTTRSGAAPAPPVAPSSVSFGEALRYWFKLGFVSFGGPAGQIALMHEDLVERRRWISERRFLHALNYCMVLPGPEAQQLATYIGWLMHRSWGGVVAGGLFVLPSLFILIALAWVYMAYGHVPAVAGLLYGIKPAVTAIVATAAWRIGSRTLKNRWLWGIAVAAFVAIFALQLPFPLIVLAAGLTGWLGGRLSPVDFATRGAHRKAVATAGPALIDDHTPTPPHARFTWPRFRVLLLAGLGLWGAAIAALTLLFGWDAVLTQMAWFFTKAALLTFGGAYAVLPYVYQGAVEHHQWLTAAQMIDDLALGETTPEPLIMVVAFVGFVGGWSQAVFGAPALFLSGAVAALVVTFFTFLPSFLFILLGAPFIESTHGNLKFTAPLTGITAAVVGVIFNLALFLGWHVLWPTGLSGGFEWASAFIGAAAAVAILRFKVGIVAVILGSALLGLAWHLVGR